MQHVITVRVEVDGEPIHRAALTAKGEGLVVDSLGEFDPRGAAVQALRTEADAIEEEGRRLIFNRERNGEWVIDADA